MAFPHQGIYIYKLLDGIPASGSIGLQIFYYYFKKISYPNRINVPITTIKKKIRINLFPFLMASFAPTQPPNALQIAIGIAIAQMIFPFKIKRQIEPKLVAKLTILALAEA
jgi:hypothetical protein